MNTHVMYEGRLVPVENFRAFVYNAQDEQKLVNSWSEYLIETSSGIWFSSKEIASEKIRKKRVSRNVDS